MKKDYMNYKFFLKIFLFVEIKIPANLQLRNFTGNKYLYINNEDYFSNK